MALGVSGFFGALLAGIWEDGWGTILVRSVTVGLVATIVFSVTEHRPRRLPRWLARWVAQIVAIGASVPIATSTIWIVSTSPGQPLFWRDPDRLSGWMLLTFLAVLVAPWTALAALVQQKDATVRDQALAFELERSELGRQALAARLQLLQAQVAPHFLFNTLANIQALVDARSPQAPLVLRSLVEYLRGAVPLLREPASTVGGEVRLVKAYLELMQMRMPDRLQYTLQVDESALSLRCPPTTLLTLVENAVRHGIDPSEEGGVIDIGVSRYSDRCLITVADTGVGLHQQSVQGLRTGLSTLRERLQLMFGADAHLRINARERSGVCAELEMPAQVAAG